MISWAIYEISRLDKWTIKEANANHDNFDGFTSHIINAYNVKFANN